MISLTSLQHFPLELPSSQGGAHRSAHLKSVRLQRRVGQSLRNKLRNGLALVAGSPTWWTWYGGFSRENPKAMDGLLKMIRIKDDNWGYPHF